MALDLSLLTDLERDAYEQHIAAAGLTDLERLYCCMESLVDGYRSGKPGAHSGRGNLTGR